MSPRQLVVEFLSTLLCALIAAAFLATIPGSALKRALMAALLGVFGWLALSVSQWTWYHFPFAFIALDLMDQAGGWFFAGLAMAKILPAARQADATAKS